MALKPLGDNVSPYASAQNLTPIDFMRPQKETALMPVVDDTSVSVGNMVSMYKETKVESIGQVAANLSTTGLAKSSIDRGADGEYRVSQAICDWITSRGVQNAILANSLRGYKGRGDIDHMLIVGNHVILIDAKRWRINYKYCISNKGFLSCWDGVNAHKKQQQKGFTQPAPARQREQWHNIITTEFPQAAFHVHAIVCVVALRKTSAEITIDDNWVAKEKNEYALLNTRILPEYLDRVLANTINQVPIPEIEHMKKFLSERVVKLADDSPETW